MKYKNRPWTMKEQSTFKLYSFVNCQKPSSNDDLHPDCTLILLFTKTYLSLAGLYATSSFFLHWLLSSWPLEVAEISCAASGGLIRACELRGWMIIELILWVVPIPIKHNWWTF